ncbi:winged helix DNA-binding domain-containing protein [Streptomyces sp. NPDC004609]|uniref:winged helix DNA-binding domain-containing protein n=1 Tax=Streptomyces sp. NPDC004609 TaxID=3364704 RepID=UPI00369A6268
MTTREVTWTGANARTLERQGLSTPASGSPAGPPPGDPAGPAADGALPGSPAGVTAAMLGAHAQVLSAAELSVATRLGGGATRTTVRDALWKEGSLVKTYGPRGTVHLLAREDLPMWTGALSAIPGGRATAPGPAGMSDEQTEQVVEAIGDALHGTSLTVDELTDAIVERTGSWAGDPVMEAFQTLWPRWRQVTHLAAHRGVLAFGPNKGRKAAYTNPEITPLDGPAALDELVRRYLVAYGPATPAHFAKWLAAPKGWANSVFTASAEQGLIEEVAYEGERAWIAAGDGSFPRAAPSGVRLLPYFDAYTIASQPRELLFAGSAYRRALAGGQAGNYPVVLVDGTVRGVWHQKRSGKRIAVTVEPIGDELERSRNRRELAEQVERVGMILEGTAELTVGEVTVGAHA